MQDAAEAARKKAERDAKKAAKAAEKAAKEAAKEAAKVLFLITNTSNFITHNFPITVLVLLTIESTSIFNSRLLKLHVNLHPLPKLTLMTLSGTTMVMLKWFKAKISPTISGQMWLL